MAISAVGRTPLARTAALIAAEKRDIGVAVIYSVGAGLLFLALPIATQSLVNTVAFGTVLQPLAVLSVLVFAALSAAALMQALRLWVIEMIQRRIFARLAEHIAGRLLRVKAEAFDSQHGPELVNRFLEVVTVQKSTALLLADGLSLAMQVIIGMLLLAAYHPLLLAFDLGLMVLTAALLFGLGRGATRTSIGESHAKYEVLAWMEEIATHRSAFRSQTASQFAATRMRGLVNHYLEERSRHFRILFRQNAGALALQALATSALLGIGGWLVIEGQLTLGQLIAAELVVSLIVSGIAKFGKSLESWYDLQAAVDKLGYLTDLPVERLTGEPTAHVRGPAALRLKNVSFEYPDGQNTVMVPSVDIAAGSTFAFYGPGGSGKSTIMDLLYALRAPSRGTIEVDGVDYREVKLDQLRDGMAMVRDQDIFAGSILENVRLGTGADLSAVRSALDNVGLLEVVSRMPNGVHTELATGGSPLSPSQARRLTIARALLTQPRLLLLDEVLDRIDDLQLKGPLVRSCFGQDAPWTLIVATRREDIRSLCQDWAPVAVQHHEMASAGEGNRA
ncbi:MAG TPA: ABC transporter ATP-binding protein [Bryobacteraceae bacterium]|nr:ABC transporter ATP-binding protein [Bryobacteraceae bacterium]